MPWSGECCAFAVEAFFKNNESVIATQRAFRTHFRIRPNDDVPTRKTILQWVAKFGQTGSTLNRKPPGRPRTARTPENIKDVRASILQSPRRSARKHAVALGMSNTSVIKTLNFIHTK